MTGINPQRIQKELNLHTRKEVASKYNITLNQLRTIIRNNNLKCPTLKNRDIYNNQNKIIELYKKGLSSIQIVKKLKLKSTSDSVINFLKRKNIAINEAWYKARKYAKLDLTKITNIQSHEIAYVIGFITADGCINIDHGKERLVIQLSRKDEHTLTTIKNILNVKNKIAIRKFKNKQHYTQVRLELIQSGLVDAFKKWNIIPNKSSTIVFPMHFPKEFIGSYLCGLFDGDGCISFTKNKSKNISSVKIRFFTGSEQYAVALKTVFESLDIMVNNIYTTPKGTCHSIEISNSDILKIYKLLYSNTKSFCMRRKLEKFEMWLQHLEDRNQCLLTRTLNHNAKLTWKQIDQIKYLYNRGFSLKKISNKYSVYPTTISNIIKGKTYVKQNKCS